jgi:hypothetical protein
MKTNALLDIALHMRDLLSVFKSRGNALASHKGDRANQGRDELETAHGLRQMRRPLPLRHLHPGHRQFLVVSC